MTGLDGVWDVERTGGALPPLRGIVHKRIENGRGSTIAAGVRLPFVVGAASVLPVAPRAQITARVDQPPSSASLLVRFTRSSRGPPHGRRS